MKNHTNREPQISEREIERKYKNVKTEDAPPKRVNCYTCQKCNKITKTIDIHHGTTPMFNKCECGGQSVSSFYRDISPDIEPAYEWFVPTLVELKKYKNNPKMLDHIFAGGLDKRKI